MKQKLIPKNLNPSNPLLTYLNSNAHKIYQRDIPSNEADPIGELFVEGAIFGKPLELAGKYIAKPLLKPVINKINNKLGLIANKYYYYLVNRAKRKNPVELHKSRINYNWDKIPSVDNNGNSTFTFDTGLKIPYKSTDKEFEIFDYNKNFNKAIEELGEIYEKVIGTTPIESRSLAQNELIHNPIHAPMSKNKVFIGYQGEQYVLKNYGKSAIDKAISHEVDHAIHIPIEKPSGFKRGINYFDKGNGSELSARGSQLKDYFGFTKNEDLTPGMLKYASKNYIKDIGMDNNMTDFFNYIEDYDKAAKWLSKHATIGLSPIIGYRYIKNNKSESD